MLWRKWMVRSLVFTIMACALGAAFAYHYWTNPVMIQREVVAKLSEHISGADVRLQSAHWRLLGGISFSELRLARRDDSGHNVFLYVPRGVIYPDKQELLDGKPGIRRIVAEGAKIHLVRRKDGTCNMSGILAPPRPDIPIPTLVIHRATILIEDQAAGELPPVLVKNVNLTFMNDPIETLNFEGEGQSDLAGPVHLTKGAWGRRSDEVSLSLQMARMPVNASLVERVRGYCPKLAADVRKLGGTLELEADLHRDPKAPSPWSYELRAQMHEGELVDARLPFRLEHIEARAHCVNDQIVLDKLEAHWGSVRLEMTGRGAAGKSDNLDVALKVEHLRFSPELLARLPEEMREIESRFQPQGLFSLLFEIHRRPEHSTKHCLIRPEQMTAVYAEFPYRLERVCGLIEHEEDTSRGSERITLDLTGYSGSKPVFIQGTVDGSKPAAIDLHIWARDVPLDDKLCNALEPPHQKLARSFSPRGVADIDAVIRRARGEQKTSGRYLIQFHDCSARYELFPYPVENVNGTLEIHPDYWECKDFRGTHLGAQMRCRGGAAHVNGENRLRFEIHGGNLPIDEELKAALAPHPNLQNAWNTLGPSGSMDFEAIVNQISDREPDIEVTVVPRRARLRPGFFPYSLVDLQGRVHYHRHVVELDRLRARHGSSLFTLEQGKVLLKPESGVSVNLVNLTGTPITPDKEFHDALPPSLARAVDVLDLRDPLSLRTNLVVDVSADGHAPPYIYWDGLVDLQDAHLQPGVGLEHVTGRIACRGQHEGKFKSVTGNLQLQQLVLYQQPFLGIHGRIVVTEAQPDVLLLPNVEAKLFDGDLGGSVRIELGETPSYEADMTVTQIKLEQFGRHNHLSTRTQLKGLASARLYLKGSGTGIGGLNGAGRFDVENGKMYDLPLLLDLLKFLNLRMPDPDHTAFEDAHARFEIHGPVIRIDRLDLIGSAICLGGKGTLHLGEAGNEIDMDLYAVWAPIEHLTPLPLKPLWPAVSKQLLKIKMKGKIGEAPRFEKVPLPPLTEPLKGFLQHLEGRQDR